ncbi:MAG: DUF305 domain-containing protein [bacterium]
MTLPFFAIILVGTLTAAACDSGPSTARTPVGPSSMPANMDAGMGAGMGTMSMPGMRLQSEFDYLTKMIPHHEEAIARATMLQQGTQRPEMRSFARSIIETQTAEVQQMQRFLAARYPGRDTYADYAPMMRDLTGLRADALDRAFLEDMVPHHMMAVMMSQRLLMAGLADNDELIPFARNIRDVQHSEIRMMAGWLEAWFGAAPLGHGMMWH